MGYARSWAHPLRNFAPFKINHLDNVRLHPPGDSTSDCIRAHFLTWVREKEARMSLRLQIDWRDANGRIVSGEPIFAHPFISVEVSSDDMVNWISAYVMIDTGLSRTMISPDVLNALNCVKGTSQSLSGSNGWQDFEGYRNVEIPARAGQSYDGGCFGARQALRQQRLKRLARNGYFAIGSPRSGSTWGQLL
jgi:hypothetical protein